MEGKIVKNSEILMKYLRILQTQIQDICNTLHDFETELYKENEKNNYETLLPCLFCGSNNVEPIHFIDRRNGESINYIKCNSCNWYSVPIKGGCMDDAIKMWNKREEVK